MVVHVVGRCFGHGHHGIGLQTMRQRNQKECFAVSGADARGVIDVRNQGLDLPADFQPATDLPVMHEHIAPMHEGMAVGPHGRGTGRCAHMRKKQRGPHLIAQRFEIFIRPCRMHFPIKTRHMPLAIPADPKAVTIGFCFGFLGMQRLMDQRMGRGADQLFHKNFFAPIGQKPTHNPLDPPSIPRKICAHTHQSLPKKGYRASKMMPAQTGSVPLPT